MGIKVLIDPRCKITVADYQNVKEDPGGTTTGRRGKLKEKETDSKTGISYQKYGHMSDTGDYVLCYAFMSEYESYQKGGKVFNVTLGKNLSKNGY